MKTEKGRRRLDCLPKEINMPRKKNEGTNKEERSERNGRVWLSEQAAADYLGVTKRTLQRWRSGVVRANGQVIGGPKYYQPAGKVFFDRDELDEWVVSFGR